MKDTSKVVQNVTFTRERGLFSGGSGLLIALSLSACGGGGGGGASTGGSQNTTTPVAGTTNPLPVIGQSGSEVTLSKSPAVPDYSFISNVNGLTLLDPELAIISVADDTVDNEYGVELNASGAGTIEFRFDDEDDTVVLSSESKMSGFSELRVTKGTVDARSADLGDITYIEVASSVSLKVSQLKSIDNIVSKSSSGTINIEVNTLDDIAELEALMASKDIEIFSEPAAFKMVKAAGSSLPDEVLKTGEQTVEQQTQPLAAAPPVVLNTPQTVVSSKPAGSIKIDNNDTYINATEATSAIIVKVKVSSGVEINSVTMGGKVLQTGASAGEYLIDASQFSDGKYTLVAKVSNAAGVTTELGSSVTIDREAPEIVSVSMSGESNGLNQAELSTGFSLNVDMTSPGYVSGVEFEGSSLQKNASGLYTLNSFNLSDGNYNLKVTTKDAAGNTSTAFKTFTVDLDAPSDASITFDGVDSLISRDEASEQIVGTASIPAGHSLKSISLDGVEMSIGAGGTVTFDANDYSEGVHVFAINSTSAAGEDVVSLQSFEIDFTAPEPITITTVGDDLTITSDENSTSLPLFISEVGDGFVESVTLNGTSLTKGAGDLSYTVNGNSLGVGAHKIKVTQADLAGNKTVVDDTLVIMGSQRTDAVFDVHATSGSNGVTKFDVFLVQVPDTVAPTLSKFTAKIDFNETVFDFYENTLTMKSGGLMGKSEADAANGLLGISGLYENAFDDFSDPLITFYATNLTGANSTSLRIFDVQINNDVLGSVDYAVVL